MKNKKVLVLCTGNSCRSIIAEAILKSAGIDVMSAGVKASGRVNPNAKKVLQKKGIWKDEFYSKTIDEVIDNDFDLIVTVCDNAKETCPVFPKKVKTIHIPFEDPDGKEYEEFVKTYNEIRSKLLPIVKKILEN
ncbi:MAG: arsenate reductase ArsC [Nautiliaceae bacterium]